MSGCYHCGEPLPPGSDYSLTIDAEPQRFCCPGCQGVARLILDHDLSHFYKYRTELSEKAQDIDTHSWQVYDRPAFLEAASQALPGGEREAELMIEGLTCGACVWLIEQHVTPDPGIQSLAVNPLTQRATLRWNQARTPVSTILARLAELGYRPRLGTPASDLAQLETARRQALKRLAVAGVGMLQVMTFAASLYIGAFQGMSATFGEFFGLISMLVATPVVLYAGAPFFQRALADLSARRPGMDVPVALAVGIAYVASVVNIFTGRGQIYFDSATMFIFFLSLGRFLEMQARHRAGASVRAMAELLPPAARRQTGTGVSTVATLELRAGDTVLVEPGQAFPGDGVIARGEGPIDETLLTGEALPRRRGPGERVLAGALNQGRTPISATLDRVGPETYLAGVGRLLNRAQAERPALVQSADRLAGWFVVGVLLVATLVAVAWWQLAPDRALGVTLAVLVVTCPCALSLATPTALTVALGALARQGLLVTSGRALETLGQVTTWVFDKTGTLTCGELVIERVEPMAAGLAPERALGIAAALEAVLSHPLARAFHGRGEVLTATDVRLIAGRGVKGAVDGQDYRLGSAAFVGHTAPVDAADRTVVYLADERQVLAAFHLRDRLRAEAVALVQSLKRAGQRVLIASGDGAGPARQVARALGIEEWHAQLLPEDKLVLIQRLQAEGATVAMVGDGINDGPVLAGANVSLAMGAGSQLAQASADIVITGASLAPLTRLTTLAATTLGVIRQNLAWALSYNALAVPVAAAGLVPPWAAAIGMSASSLVVVLNALRLRGLLEAPQSTAAGIATDPPALVAEPR
jgi:Cu2+-exporting ATPase